MAQLQWLITSFSFAGGYLRLYTENLKSQPIISVLDENPLPIQFVSFASFENTEDQYFYNCSHINYNV